MRLIDADRLLEDKRIEKYYHLKNGDTAIPIIDIRHAPTVEELKKGKWKMKPDPYGFFEEIPVCSECGCTTEMRKTYNYCPNCGADMRGEQDE